MSDCVFIRGLAFETVIGIYDWEKNQAQPISFDVDMYHDQSAAAEGDDIDHALDYEKISNRIMAFVDADTSELVETLAERVAQMLLSEFAIERLDLTLHKPNAVPAAASVGVRISRQRAR